MALPNKQSELRLPTSRRNLLKLGGLALGGMALASVPTAISAQTSNGAKTIRLRNNDTGILNFALLLEELEAAFYQQAAQSGQITDTQESEYIEALGRHESEHVSFLREVLGQDTAFETNELSFNQQGVSELLADCQTILDSAVLLEDLSVHAYNGAGVKIKNPTYLRAAGSIVSVEGRHSAGVRGLLGRSATQTPEERQVSDADLASKLNPFQGRAYDELCTPKQIVSVVDSLNILNNPIRGSLVR